MNQENIADILKTTRQTYSNIENGKTEIINPKFKKILMKTFNLNEEELEQRESINYNYQEGTNVGRDGNITNLNEKLIESFIEQNNANIKMINSLVDLINNLNNSK